MLVTIITAALVVVLVSIFAWQVVAAREQQREAARIRIQASVARDIVLVREALRAELSLIDAIIADPQPVAPAFLTRLTALHARSGAVLRRLEAELEYNPAVSGSSNKILIAHAGYDAQFARVLALAGQSASQRPALTAFDPRRPIYEVVATIDAPAIDISRDIASTGPYMSMLMKVSDVAWFVRGFAGDDRRTTATLIAEGRAPNRREIDRMAHVRGAIDGPWQFIGMAARQKDFPPALLKSVKEAERLYFIQYRALQAKVIAQLTAGQKVDISGHRWQALTAPGVDSLKAVSQMALDITGAHARTRENIATREFYQALLLMLASIGLASLGAVYVIFRVVRPLRQITAALDAFNAGARPQPIAFNGRQDEIGQFSRALNRFQKNVAEKKALEIEVMRKHVEKEAAVNANRIKSEFLANMSHELRTPLNAVIGFSDMMLHKTFGPLGQRYEEYARLINESGTHLLHLVSDILDLAKVEAGKMVLDIHDLDLGETVGNALMLSSRSAEAKRVELVTRLPEARLLIKADARACKQIVLNLVSNAVKFCREGGRVEVSVEVEGEFACLTVRDNGIGIPADVLPKLGVAFEQAANNPLLAREGTGLGLALVRNLAEAHGGSLHIDSIEDTGTTVTVRLPLRQKVQAAA